MHSAPARDRAMPGLGWLRSLGRLSYEVYLTHMFVVYTVVAAFRAAGGDARHAWWVYPPAVLACWCLGEALARTLTGPADRWLRQRWLRPSPQQPALQVTATRTAAHAPGSPPA